MNVFCPTCGSQNEAASKFCWKCGTSLAAVPRPDDIVAPTEPSQPAAPAPTPPAAAPAPAMPASTPQPPPAASPPAAAPTPAPPPVVAPPPALPTAPAAGIAAPPPALPGGPPLKSRLSTPVLIGGLVAVLGIGAAAGIVLGIGGEPTPSHGVLPTSAPSIDLRTPGPVVSLAPIPTSGPVATAVVATPAPVTPTPGPGGGGSQDVSIANISITVPAGWEAELGESSITLFPTEGGYVYLESLAVSGALTASEVLQLDIDYFEENRADTEVCGAEEDFTLHNGPAGKAMYLCYTTESQSGNSYKAILFVAAATVASGGNTAIFYVSVFAPEDIWDTVLTVVQPVLPSIHWNLYQGG